jgi:hypothetical protein
MEQQILFSIITENWIFKEIIWILCEIVKSNTVYLGRSKILFVTYAKVNLE